MAGRKQYACRKQDQLIHELNKHQIFNTDDIKKMGYNEIMRTMNKHSREAINAALYLSKLNRNQTSARNSRYTKEKTLEALLAQTEVKKKLADSYDIILDDTIQEECLLEHKLQSVMNEVIIIRGLNPEDHYITPMSCARTSLITHYQVHACNTGEIVDVVKTIKDTPKSGL